MLANPCLFCGKFSFCGLCPACRARLLEAYAPKTRPLLFAERTLTLFAFENEVLQELLYRLKQSGARLCVKVFCEFLSKAAKELGKTACAVTYIPRRRRRLSESGVDQARLLARALARELGLPCVRMLRVVAEPKRQHGLSAAKRRENVHGVWRSTRRLPIGRDVLLVDDVITTGATCEEACRVLTEAGVGRIFVLAPVRGGGF